ncbi:MAG TPA: phosphate ABC transporter permease [Planctomycetales bacterium]|nr:phosphate ABC transporter permease [Planctomycetales bacterium]
MQKSHGSEIVSSAADTVPEEAIAAPPPVVAEAAAADDLPETVIERRPGWQLVDLRELWRYRELLFFLSWRDVKVRYKQTILGAGWALLQPLATMVVFAFFLGRMGGVSEGIANYPLFVFAGVVPWTFFANAVSMAGNSVVANERLVSKIYFPRLIIPIGSVGGCLFDFVIALGLLAGMMAWYRVVPGWQIVLAPVVMVLLTATAVGVGTLLAALIVAHRDFKYVLNFAVQLWMFATPCIYLPPRDIGPNAHLLLPLNPAYGLLLNFRLAMLGNDLDWYALGVSAAVGVASLLIGCLYFRRVERTFADVI